ncbi:MAG: tetratricopeptide repeat protein [Saprospiraceae bacterium]
MFRFEHPYFLHLFWALLALPLILLAYVWWRRRAIMQIAVPASAQRVLPGWSRWRFWAKNTLLLAAIALLALAWANPQRGAKQQTVVQKSADVFIALDISRSMLAEDVAPNRLELAKSFVRKLIRALEGERIGLIFFAGDAFLQMPLSTDYAAADMFVASADPDLVTAQGTAIPRAVDLASEHFDSDPGGGRALVLVTDGENHDNDAEGQVAEAYADGIVTFAVGAGTGNGGPIPVGTADAEERYLRDEAGEIVRTRMDEGLLDKLASAGGGAAYRLSQGDAALRAIRREVGRLEKRAREVRSFNEFESYFQWFLLPAFLLLVLEAWFSWRKKKAAVLVLLCVFGHGLPAQSAHKHLRDGDRSYERSNFGEAEQAYRRAGEKKPDDPKVKYNLGNALYRQGSYPEAEKLFEQSAKTAKNPALKADALHNLGNASLLQEKYEQAVQAYENSLRLRPGDPETKANLQLAKKKWQQEQEKQERQNQQQQQNQQTSDSTQQQQQPPQKPDQQQQDQQPANQQPKPEGEQQPQEQQPTEGQMTREQARRLLETAVSPEDRKNARKYREQEQGKHQTRQKKEW